LSAVEDLFYPIFTAGNLKQLDIIHKTLVKVKFLLIAKQSATSEWQTGSNDYSEESVNIHQNKHTSQLLIHD